MTIVTVGYFQSSGGAVIELNKSTQIIVIS